MDATAQSQVQQNIPPIQQENQATQPSAKSSKILLITLVVIIVITLGMVAYIISGSSSSNTPVIQSRNQAESSLSPVATTNQPNQDTAGIDTELGNLQSDLGNVDQSLTDKPVDLSQ